MPHCLLEWLLLVRSASSGCVIVLRAISGVSALALALRWPPQTRALPLFVKLLGTLVSYSR